MKRNNLDSTDFDRSEETILNPQNANNQEEIPKNIILIEKKNA